MLSSLKGTLHVKHKFALKCTKIYPDIGEINIFFFKTQYIYCRELTGLNIVFSLTLILLLCDPHHRTLCSSSSHSLFLIILLVTPPPAHSLSIAALLSQESNMED